MPDVPARSSRQQRRPLYPTLANELLVCSRQGVRWKLLPSPLAGSAGFLARTPHSASACAAWRPPPIPYAASSGPPLLLLLGLSRPESFCIHGVEQDGSCQSGDPQRPERRQAEKHWRRRQQADVEAAEEIGDQARWERPSLTGDHRCAEVDAFRLGPANGRQQSRCRCGNGHHGRLGHRPLHGTIAETQVRRGGRHGPDRRQDRRYGDRGQLDARQ